MGFVDVCSADVGDRRIQRVLRLIENETSFLGMIQSSDVDWVTVVGFYRNPSNFALSRLFFIMGDVFSPSRFTAIHIIFTRIFLSIFQRPCLLLVPLGLNTCFLPCLIQLLILVVEKLPNVLINNDY